LVFKGRACDAAVVRGTPGSQAARRALSAKIFVNNEFFAQGAAWPLFLKRPFVLLSSISIKFTKIKAKSIQSSILKASYKELIYMQCSGKLMSVELMNEKKAAVKKNSFQKVKLRNWSNLSIIRLDALREN
jgi:hypothetical protein